MAVAINLPDTITIKWKSNDHKLLLYGRHGNYIHFDFADPLMYVSQTLTDEDKWEITQAILDKIERRVERFRDDGPMYEEEEA